MKEQGKREDEDMVTWQKELRMELDFSHLFETILYGQRAVYKEKSYLDREKDNWEMLEQKLGELGMLDEDTLNMFEQFEEVLQRNYFEMGVRLGACLEEELVGKIQSS